MMGTWILVNVCVNPKRYSEGRGEGDGGEGGRARGPEGPAERGGRTPPAPQGPRAHPGPQERTTATGDPRPRPPAPSPSPRIIGRRVQGQNGSKTRPRRPLDRPRTQHPPKTASLSGIMTSPFRCSPLGLGSSRSTVRTNDELPICDTLGNAAARSAGSAAPWRISSHVERH